MRGISLLELLIAMALGLLVLGAALYSTAGMVVAGRQQRALSQMSNDALLALSLIRRDLLMAGYVHPHSISNARFTPANTLVQTRPVYGCNSAFNVPDAPVADGVCASSSTRNDAIEVNFEANKGSADLSTDDRLIDCQGAKLTVPATASPAAAAASAADELTRIASSHRYFVSAPAGESPRLSCASAVSSTAPLVDLVEALRFTYGVATGWNSANPTTRRPVRYVDANQVSDWSQVVAVQVCVLMRSEAPVLDSRETGTHGYTDCDGTSKTSSDFLLRRAYSTTVALRNRVAW